MWHCSSPVLTGCVTILRRASFPSFCHPASSMTRFLIISGFPLTFGQRVRSLPNFSKWKNISHTYVPFKSQFTFDDTHGFLFRQNLFEVNFRSLISSPSPSLPGHLQSMWIFVVYSVFTLCLLCLYQCQLVGQQAMSHWLRHHCCPAGRTYLSMQYDLHTNFQSLLNMPTSFSATKHLLVLCCFTDSSREEPLLFHKF